VTRRLPVAIVLLVLAAITGWAVWTQRPRDDGKARANARSDYVLTRFEAIVLDKQGQESFTIRAPRLARNPGDQTMTLETPLFLIPAVPAPGQPPSREAGWEVRANTGWVSAGGDELRLTGNVTAKSVDTRDKPVVMATQQMNVFPDTNRATAPGTVTVTQPGSILSGQGMDALLDSKRIRFSSKVKMHYVPSR
jgi:lipopolysaccharide export system protein LptC